MIQLSMIQLTQEIGLIFMRISRPHQVHIAISICFQISIMTGCNVLGTQLMSIFNKSLEFDLFVADNVRIRRAALLVFCNEVLKDSVPVFLFKVY